MKDKVTAAILAFFLGPLGVHRFYLGQAGLGILYLLFCWTPLIWVIAFIDFIVLLTYSKRGFDQKYNRQLFNPYSQNPPAVQNQVHVYNQSPVISSQATPPPIPGLANELASSQSGYDALERLHSLKEKGVLTEEEFALEKRKVLGNPDNTLASPNSNDPFLG